MTGFITNYIQNKAISTATGLLEKGVTAAGTLAGNAVGGIGSVIENGGRSVGEGKSPNSCNLKPSETDHAFSSISG